MRASRAGGCLILAAQVAASLSAETVAYWRFDEGPLGSDVPAGENAVLDASGNGNHLRAWAETTAPTYLSDLPFRSVPLTGEENRLALNFTPRRDLYTEGKPINSRALSAWTIEASFKPLVTDQWQVVVGKDGNAVGSAPLLSLKILATNGRLELGLLDGAGQWRTVVSQEPLRAGEWYSVAGTATSTVMSLWLKGPGDAAFISQGMVGISGASYGGLSRPWTVGRGMWQGNLTDWFDGVVDQIRISDTAMQPDQFLASPRPVTDPAELEARAVLVERAEDGEQNQYLALDSWSAGAAETLGLQASPNLIVWDRVSHTAEVVGESGGRERVRLVSDIQVEDHARYFLRAEVLQKKFMIQPQNPILPGADPEALLVGETAWIYPTYRAGDGRFFAFSSTDLVAWRIHGPILDFANIGWIPEGKQAWAPGVTQKNGNFYLYYSAGPKPSYIGVAVADSPSGPFIDSGAPLLFDDGAPGFEAIDAMVFNDPQSDKSYLYAGGSAGAKLRVFELNPDMVSFAREMQVTTPPNFTEGAFMHFHDGRYYLSYSSGVWWDGSYEVHYAIAPTPYGPWAYHGAILVSDENHRGPGHHSILHNPRMNQWYIIYHRWNNQTGPGPYDGHRTVAIDLLEYDQLGIIKPVVMTNTGVGPVDLGPTGG